MPRKFTDADVIRIWCKHLTIKQQAFSLFVFIFIFPDVLLEKLTGIESLSFIFKIIFQLRKFMKVLPIFDVLIDIVISFFPKKIVKVLKGCIVEEIDDMVVWDAGCRELVLAVNRFDLKGLNENAVCTSFLAIDSWESSGKFGVTVFYLCPGGSGTVIENILVENRKLADDIRDCVGKSTGILVSILN